MRPTEWQRGFLSGLLVGWLLLVVNLPSQGVEWLVLYYIASFSAIIAGMVWWNLEREADGE